MKNEYNPQFKLPGRTAAKAANADANPSEVVLHLCKDMIRLVLEHCVQFTCKCFSSNVRNW